MVLFSIDFVEGMTILTPETVGAFVAEVKLVTSVEAFVPERIAVVISSAVAGRGAGVVAKVTDEKDPLVPATVLADWFELEWPDSAVAFAVTAMTVEDEPDIIVLLTSDGNLEAVGTGADVSDAVWLMVVVTGTVVDDAPCELCAKISKQLLLTKNSLLQWNLLCKKINSQNGLQENLPKLTKL